MASADFQKIKTAQETKAKIAHDDKNMRLKHEHTNKHINKSLTRLNTDYFTNMADGSPYGYAEVCAEYDHIMECLDAAPKANKRKDRVTCVSIEIPTPDNLKPEDEGRFFRMCGRALCEKYGEENLLQGYFHRDEQHDYYDKESGSLVMSRNHGTFRFVPVVDGKLNAKEFTKRANIIDVNNTLQEECINTFGIPFNNGKGKRGKSVEQLKNESEKAMALIDLQAEKDALERSKMDFESEKETYKEKLRLDAESALNAEKERLGRVYAQKDKEREASFETRVKAEVDKRVNFRQRADKPSSNIEKPKRQGFDLDNFFS